MVYKSLESSKTKNKKAVIVSSTPRVAYWDIAKAVAIFCVVWGHCLQNMTTDKNYLCSDTLSQFIYSFHMPLFMIISGYFAFGSLSRPIGTALNKRMYQLIVPSISWLIVISLLAMAFHRDFVEERFRNIIVTLPFSFWFLKSLFLCYFITLVGARLMRWRKWTIYIYVLVIFCLGEVLNYSSTISMLTFFITGLLLNTHKKIVSSHQHLIMVCCLLIFSSLFIFWDSNEYNIYQNPFKHNWGGV